jgi:hypothetical protein
MACNKCGVKWRNMACKYENNKIIWRNENNETYGVGMK